MLKSKETAASLHVRVYFKVSCASLPSLAKTIQKVIKEVAIILISGQLPTHLSMPICHYAIVTLSLCVCFGGYHQLENMYV